MDVGHVLAKVLASRNAVIIASSDMTHYEPQKVAEAKDMDALKAVELMGEQRFYRVLERENVTACGYAPIAALIVAAKGLGATTADLLCYKTSGDTTGDYSSVVGYAAVSFKK